MISNAIQLRVAQKQLFQFQKLLEAMRLELNESHPELFPTVAEGYLRRIESIQQEIFEYYELRSTESSLMVKIDGPEVETGKIKANVASNLISGIQSAMYCIGGFGRVVTETNTNSESSNEIQEDKGPRSLLELSLVATAPGSFILALDLASRQKPLFKEFDTPSVVINNLINYINEIRNNAENFSGDRTALVGLKKVSSLVKKGVETIQITFRDEDEEVSGLIDSLVKDRIDYLLGSPKEDELTIVGTLIEINTQSNSCEVLQDDNKTRITCGYEDVIEDDLISVLKKRLQIAGQFVLLDSGKYRITKIERFKQIDDE